MNRRFVVTVADLEVYRPAPAFLEALFLDDNLPAGYAKTFAWSKESGPGSVTFTPASGSISNSYLSAMATFSTTGTYVLRVTVSDSVLSDSDTLVVAVLPGTNAPPVAFAGADQIVALPHAATLHTEVHDDGLEEGLLE